MNGLRQEIAAFLENKQSTASEARQLAALQIACHLDLAEALRAEPAARATVVLKLERMIERERQRGMRKHWSYDLNRHIALKQASDRLKQSNGAPRRTQKHRETKDGARRRRQLRTKKNRTACDPV